MNGISLFSNVGIGELYLKNGGINIKIANEIEPKRAQFYKHIYPETDMVVGDINEKFDELVRKAKEEGCEFLIATPPCQGMSIAGKMDDKDERNELIIPVLNMIEELHPKYVLIENVPRMLTHKIVYKGIEDTVENTIQRVFRQEYHINKNKILNTQDYQVPQNRRRTIILMSTEGDWEYPEKNELITVRQAIGDLPSVEAIVDGDVDYFAGNSEKIKKCLEVHKWHTPKQHNKHHVEIMQHTPTGHSAFENEVYYPKRKDGKRVTGYPTTYKRMEWDKPAPTITMGNGGISSQNNVHPGRQNEDGTYSDARVLTVYELMVLSTIPTDWDIPEWASESFIRRVIGEGIPPKAVELLVQNRPTSKEHDL